MKTRQMLTIYMMVFTNMQVALAGGYRVRVKVPTLRNAQDMQTAVGKSPLDGLNHAACAEETRVPEEMIAEALKGNLSDDNRLKCYMKCLFVLASVIDDRGRIDTEEMRKLLPLGIADKIVAACGRITRENTCQLSYEIHVCAQKYSKENLFSIQL